MNLDFFVLCTLNMIISLSSPPEQLVPPMNRHLVSVSIHQPFRETLLSLLDCCQVFHFPRAPLPLLLRLTRRLARLTQAQEVAFHPDLRRQAPSLLPWACYPNRNSHQVTSPRSRDLLLQQISPSRFILWPTSKSGWIRPPSLVFKLGTWSQLMPPCTHF